MTRRALTPAVGEPTIVCGLDEAAIKALRKWRFNPGTNDGHPVLVLIPVEMTFKLN